MTFSTKVTPSGLDWRTLLSSQYLVIDEFCDIFKRNDNDCYFESCVFGCATHDIGILPGAEVSPVCGEIDVYSFDCCFVCICIVSCYV